MEQDERGDKGIDPMNFERSNIKESLNIGMNRKPEIGEEIQVYDEELNDYFYAKVLDNPVFCEGEHAGVGYIRYWEMKIRPGLFAVLLEGEIEWSIMPLEWMID